MSALPIASEIESVVAIVEESPIETVMAHLEALEAKIDHIAKEALKDAYAEIAALKKALKKVIKLPRAKRAAKAAGGAGAKAEAPKQVGVWNAFVRDTQELMKTSGWPAFEITDKNGKAVTYPGGVEDGSIWLVDANEPKKRVAPTYKLAMSYAAYRKANGDYNDPSAEDREVAKEKKVIEKEAEKSAKAAEREAKKAEKEAAKAATKAAKEIAKPAAKTVAKSAAKPMAKSAAKPEAKSAAKPEAKPVAKPEAKPVAKPEAKPEAAEVEAAEVEEETNDENPIVWTLGKKKYFKTPTSHMVWEMNGTKPGTWVGVWDPTSNKIDTAADEPEYEFD